MLQVFAVFDSKGAAFGTPMFVPTKGMAIRSFSDVVADGKSNISRHPEDYGLFEIGSYEPNTGLIKPISPPVQILSASSVASMLAPAPEKNGVML